MPPDESADAERPDPGEPADWLRYARSDLRLSQETPEGVLSEALCFHAQQAAEKAAKAVLVSSEQSVPHVHDIGVLLDQLPGHVEVPSNVRRAVRLNEYAVTSRYPAGQTPVTEEEHQQAVRWAERAVAWAEEQVEEMS